MKNDRDSFFVSGDNVIYKNKEYKFGYMGSTGKAIIYDKKQYKTYGSEIVSINDLKHKNENSN